MVEVVQINLHHAKAASAVLTRTLRACSPSIGLVQEPWTSTNKTILGLSQAVAKLGKLLADNATLSEEWGSGWSGTSFIVEIEETASASIPNLTFPNSSEELNDFNSINGTNIARGPKIIVRTEEVLIVGLVLLLWAGAIMLFINRWGKIRMLEPYQPKFQPHRASCDLADTDELPTHQRSSMSRMSMGCINNVNGPSSQFAMCNPSLYVKAFAPSSRPRQNSVFVGPSPSQIPMQRPPRKARSAMDLHTLVLDETAEQV